MALAVGMVAPLLVILLAFVHPEPEIWRHLVEHLLAELVLNTIFLAAGVLAGTAVLGVGLAWLTAMCDFPGRRFFSWALMLPLAVPTYVLAFVFLGLLDYTGPLQTWLRAWEPTAGISFPQVRSAPGVIAVMSLALYPYVYLLARNAFSTQGRRALEAAQSLGRSRVRAFFKVALPMARPWVAGGLMLVLMETLADFGAVSIFNYDTFTTAIYKAWYGFFSLPAAAQLSSLLLLMVFWVVVLEQSLRRKQRYAQPGKMSMESGRIQLDGWTRWAAWAASAAVVLLGFVVPFGQLVAWSVQIFGEEFNGRYGGLVWRSLALSAFAAAVIVACGLLLAYAHRRHQDRATRLFIRISTLGYALPGAVLAVGIVMVVSHLDRALTGALGNLFGVQPDPILQGTLWALIAAYTARFLTVGFNTVNSAMQRLTPSIDEASAIMGVTGWRLLRRVHLPMLKTGVITAAVLVFVDVMKEMPITLMTRPFGWDTLAVKIFELTSEGEWQRAALPAVALVMAGLVPVIMLTRQSEQR